LKHLFATYDTSFLITLGLQYFINGMKLMLSLAALDQFKEKYGLEPGETQKYSSYMVLPWTPKIVYGIFIDTFPICGSKKKSYLVILSLLQAVSALFITLFPLPNVGSFVAALITISFCSAVMDVVVDGLMVIQARKDPTNGSEDLQAYSWGLVSLGGVIGGSCGGYLIEYVGTLYVYAIVSAMSFILAASSLLMKKSVENTSEAEQAMSFCQRSKKNLKEIKRGLSIRELYRTLIFFLVLGAVVPSFGDFLYYY